MTAEEQLNYLESRQAPLDAQQYLSQSLHLDTRIALKLAQLDVMREKHRKLCQALGKPMDGLPPALEVQRREEEVLADYAALLQLQQEISAHIRQVPDAMQQAVLDMRYLEGAPFFRIAMALHYDERTVYRLHRAGLRHVAAQLMQAGIVPPPESNPAAIKNSEKRKK